MSPAYSRTGYPVTYCIQGIHRYTSSHSRMSRPEQRYRPSRQNWNTSFFCNQEQKPQQKRHFLKPPDKSGNLYFHYLQQI